LARHCTQQDDEVMHSLCGNCAYARVIVSGTGSRFLLCQKSQEDRRYPKYPPQPVQACVGFKPASDESRDHDRR
jgi:hypothetical protein